MTDEILVSRENGIMIVTINRPKAKNAVNKAVSEGIAAAMEELDDSSELQVAIITGADGTFCSGMDLKGFLKGESPIAPGRGFAGLTQRGPKKPLIAAVEGYALAGGLELLMACDLIVAAEDAQFGIPEVKRGLAAGAGGLIKLPRQMPHRLAMELALTGDSFTAQRAYETGIINRVVKKGEALQGAITLAKTIAANGPLAVIASKQIVNESQDWSAEEMWSKQAKLMMPVFVSEDSREGPLAFAEKRAPVWKGK
ncbi:MAG: crotonase/enoyl-CoA hydratase family protein [Pseudomonadales bacterium]|nr:crotonase/enoyl-CoA hydratase family protein [Pseudomonadales bacterium]